MRGAHAPHEIFSSVEPFTLTGIVLSVLVRRRCHFAITVDVSFSYPMKSSNKVIFGMSLGLVLLLASPLTAAPTRDWSNWVAHYYENPQPEKVVPAVYALSRAGYFEEAGQPATAIGFLATVFAQNPDKVANWASSFRDLPASHQRLVAAALWYSGVPAGQNFVRAQVRSADPVVRGQVAELVASTAPALSETAVLSESSLNLQWGAFVASGNPQHVVNVLTALGSAEPGLSGKARSVLAAKAASHAKVYAICEAQLATQSGDVRAQLTAALSAASPAR